METFLNRGEMERLSQPTVLDNGKRIPGLKTNHPRQLALMHALVRFSHVAGGGIFTSAELLPHVVETLGCSVEQYKMGSLRYDLSKLRAKGAGATPSYLTGPLRLCRQTAKVPAVLRWSLAGSRPAFRSARSSVRRRHLAETRPMLIFVRSRE